MFFYEKRHNVGTPGSLPFLLNSAVDALFKTEFEIYRINQEPHPLFEENNLNLFL